MKKTIEYEVRRSLEKLERIDVQVKEIQSKISRLSNQLQVLEGSIQEEEQNILKIGLKGLSQNPEKPETAEELQAKDRYNAKLQEEKFQIVQEVGMEQQISREKFQRSANPLVAAAQAAYHF